MNILVCYATKHQATRGIAEAIGEALMKDGRRVDVLSIAGPINLGQYDAIIFGSAVYMGKWLPEATTFAHDAARILAEKPLWLFSSGPVGDSTPPSPFELAEVQAFAREVGARGHRIFAGRLDPHDLSHGQRAIVKMVHAPTGDFRDWAAIGAWAQEIERELPVAR